MKRTTLLLAAGLVLSFPAKSQELNCTVSVNAEKIPSTSRDYLINFGADVEKYINSNRWTDEDFGGEKIQCTMNIFFQNVLGENRYQAQVFVGSHRPIYVGNDKSGKSTTITRILDDKWEFTYVPNQQMFKDDYRFEPLTSFLNYYAYLIVGLDLDTYAELSGTRYLQKALSICNQASSTSYGKDWQQAGTTYSRFTLVDELMNLKFQPFRLAFFTYHFDGLDLLSTEKEKGLENMLKAVEMISQLRERQNPRSILVRTFFDAKYMEIAETFLQYPDRSVYSRLATADPNHQGTYDEYRRK